MLTRVVKFFWKNSDTRVKLALQQNNCKHYTYLILFL